MSSSLLQSRQSDHTGGDEASYTLIQDTEQRHERLKHSVLRTRDMRNGTISRILQILGLSVILALLFAAIYEIESNASGQAQARVPFTEFPVVKRMFVNDSRQYSIPSIPWTPKAMARQYGAWKRLFPHGRGFVNVTNPQRFPDLPPPMVDFIDAPPADGVYRFGVAVFHQLHCLFTLQRYFYEVAAGRRAVDWKTLGHYDHCVDYLRQTLVCHADTTLEGQDPAQDRFPDASGLGVLHECRDFGAVYAWAEEMRWNDLSSLDFDIAD